MVMLASYKVNVTYCVRVRAFSRADAELRALEVLERNAKEARLLGADVKEEDTS